MATRYDSTSGAGDRASSPEKKPRPPKSLWWNVFASRACLCFQALGSVMVLVVLGVVALTYYTTVVLVYGPAALDDRDNNNNAAGAWVVLAIYHVLIVMTLWSYFACVLTDPGRVPPGWAPPPEDEEDERVRTSNSEKRRRFCRKCTAWKPERSHHCSVCGRCVLKMDHHCVWVASCVGAYNYKHFILFLLYTFAACVFDAVALASTFVSYWADVHDGSHREKTDEEKMTMAAVFVTFFVDVAFAASLLGFIVMHANLNLSNMTTIEMYEKKKTLPWRYDRGKRKNFTEVFGTTIALWFLPLHSAHQMRRLLDVSRLSGGSYPRMVEDGLDPIAPVRCVLYTGFHTTPSAW